MVTATVAGAVSGRLPGRTAAIAVVRSLAIDDFGFPTISGTPVLTERETSRE